MKIAGTSAVVTGGGNGIGRAVSLALARNGANVAVADIELDAAAAVATEIERMGLKSLAVAVDVSREDDVVDLADEAWSAFGSVELLFNNAGVMPPGGPLIGVAKADFDWCFSVNVGGVMNGIRVFAPRFIESAKPAWIVNTGSEHSLGVPHLFGGAYTASKHAVLGLSDVLARELPKHVGVSVLCPGITQSTLWRATERRPQDRGGPLAGDPAGAAAMALGMPVEQVAERVIAGVETETFFIMTHAHVVEIARERWDAVAQAFAAQVPRHPGDEVYEVNEVMRRLRDTR